MSFIAWPDSLANTFSCSYTRYKYLVQLTSSLIDLFLAFLFSGFFSLKDSDLFVVVVLGNVRRLTCPTFTKRWKRPEEESCNILFLSLSMVFLNLPSARKSRICGLRGMLWGDVLFPIMAFYETVCLLPKLHSQMSWTSHRSQTVSSTKYAAVKEDYSSKVPGKEGKSIIYAMTA